MKRLGTILASFGIAACINAQTATNTIDVNTSKLGASIQPTMYGIFFEDMDSENILEQVFNWIETL